MHHKAAEAPEHFMVMLSFFHQRLQIAPSPSLALPHPSTMLTEAYQCRGQMTPEITAAGTK